MDNDLNFKLHSNVLSKLKTIDQYVQFSKANGTLKKEDPKVKEVAFVALEELEGLLDNGRTLPQLSHRSIVNLSEGLEKTTEKLRQAANSQSLEAREVAPDQREEFTEEHSYIADCASRVHQVVQEKTMLFTEVRQEHINQWIDFFKENDVPSLREEIKKCLLEIAKGGFSHSSQPTCSIEEAVDAFLHALNTSQVGKTVQKKIAKALQDDTLFSFEELKTGQVTKQGKGAASKAEAGAGASLAGCIKGLKEGEITSRNNESWRISQTLKQLSKQRNFCLQNLHLTYAAMQREPPQRACATTKYFPPTAVWWVANRRLNNSSLDQEMARCGLEQGIQVVSNREPEAEAGPNRYFASKCTSRFPQDYLETSYCEVRLLAREEEGVFTAQDQEEEDALNRLSASIYLDREARNPSLWGTSDNPYFLCDPLGMSWQSVADRKGSASLPLELALAVGAPVSMNLTYSEGGNVIWAERKGIPCMIVGKDSVAASKAILESQLGRPLTGEEVKMAFAVDYGMNVADIFFVEQAGDFHLDMSMVSVGPDHLIINDSLEALKIELQVQLKDHPDFSKHMAEINRIVEEIYLEETNHTDLLEVGNDLPEPFLTACRLAVFRYRLESCTARELVAADFRVDRLPGRFYTTIASEPEDDLAQTGSVNSSESHSPRSGQTGIRSEDQLDEADPMSYSQGGVTGSDEEKSESGSDPFQEEISEEERQVEVANFFNIVTASGRGEEKLVVMPHCSDDFVPYRTQIEAQFREHHKEVMFAYLSQEMAEACLQAEGGLSCSVKSFAGEI